MPVDRIKRVNELLRRELAEAILRLPADEAFDRSVITLTHVETARNLRTAVVSVSVREHEAFGAPVMAHLRRHRVELQTQVNSALKLKYTPRLVFRLDTAIVKGDRVLDVLLKLDLPAPSPDQPDGDEDQP